MKAGKNPYSPNPWVFIVMSRTTVGRFRRHELIPATPLAVFTSMKAARAFMDAKRERAYMLRRKVRR